MFLLSSYAMKFPMKKSKKAVKKVLFKSHQGRFCIDLYKDLKQKSKRSKNLG